jgi:hypothetical protein
MSTEYNPQQYQLNPNQTDYTSDPPWADLELTVPNNRSPISIVSFVECVLVELTHEPVAAEYVSPQIWGDKRTRFFAVDDTGERFQKRYSDDRLGSHNTLLSRRRVRRVLINRLSRETVGTKRGIQEPVEEPDTFRMRPLRELVF